MKLLDHEHSFKLVDSNFFDTNKREKEVSQISVFSILYISTIAFIELLKGLLILRRHRISVTFFGSAREVLDERYYREAEILSASLAKKGFDVITGGAMGIMRDANKGAYESGGHSIGFNINLKTEQFLNQYTTEQLTCRFFFTRKTLLSIGSELYIFFPGGYGTLDELFNVLTRIQTNKLPKIPIILFGRDYWSLLNEFILEALKNRYKTISPEDIHFYKIVDSADEAIAYVESLKLKNRQIKTLNGDIGYHTRA